MNSPTRNNIPPCEIAVASIIAIILAAVLGLSSMGCQSLPSKDLNDARATLNVLPDAADKIDAAADQITGAENAPYVATIKGETPKIRNVHTKAVTYIDNALPKVASNEEDAQKWNNLVAWLWIGGAVIAVIGAVLTYFSFSNRSILSWLPKFGKAEK